MSNTDIDLSTRKFVLATDLDGTFLGGSEEERRTLYDWIEANRDTIGLIFVTGRDPKFIRELCEGGVPWPSYAIGDVGTSIMRVDGKEVEPIEALEEEIAAAWNDRGDEVRKALDGHPGLTAQDTAFRYRVSFDLDPDKCTKESCRTVEEMGLDWLVSDGKYFDVLPKGVSKGPSIKRLVQYLGIEPAKTLCAGDTLNDLSMLECGLPAVAVGNSEAALVEKVQDLPHVYMAKAHGAAGILEAVDHLDLHTTP